MSSLSTRFMKLVSGVTILTLIATLTDAHVLPNRSIYKYIVYEESPILSKTLKNKENKQDKLDKLE